MYHLIFNENDLKILDLALGNMPFKQVSELINKINAQIQQKENEEQLKLE